MAVTAQEPNRIKLPPYVVFIGLFLVVQSIIKKKVGIELEGFGKMISE